jgi:hypothetical protein
MASGIQVDPAALAQAGQGVGSAAQDFAGGLTELQSTVTTENPWGSDEAGSIFGALYVAVLGHALDSMSSHLDTLVQGAEGLFGWAELMDGTESAVTESFTSLADSVGG